MFNNGEKLNVRWKPLGQYRAMAKIGSTSYTYELPKQMQKKFESMKKEQEVEIQKSIKKSHEKLAEKVKEDN
ncbi:hypothetical protein SAMN05192552_102439 [Natrinema hispanicum]|uniref:Uncharacterized protein n=2 Tax=Natrinema hispanicum TaxID=392421 RepID=A0A1G6V1N0_9EURY|nr:hypothetical protein SAMN05192552_102439 [Natrinema hispanicum]